MRFQQLAEDIHELFFISTPTLDQFFYVSPACELLLQLRAEELCAHPELFFASVHPEERARVKQAITQLEQRGEPIELEYRTQLPGTDTRWLWLRAWHVNEPEGRPGRLSGIVTDITTRKAAESALSKSNEDLVRASQMKDEFLASMSHELRTPLNAVLGITEAMQAGIYGETTMAQMKALDELETSGRHLLTLLNDMLDIAKIESGQISLDWGPVNVNRVCHSSLQMIRQAAAQKQLVVESLIAESVETIYADERRLKQILANLLSNAVKFTANGGRVGLEVRGDPVRNQVSFVVWDTGIGIKAEDQARIFRPFVQVDSRLSRQHPGTGLGLALVRSMIELHRGAVTLVSEPGRGSRFTVTLPWRQVTLTRPGAALMAEQTQAPQGISGALLVVTKNPALIAALNDHLSPMGFEQIVHSQADGIIGLTILTRPTALLIDASLNERVNPSLVEQIRADRRTRETPIVLVASSGCAVPQAHVPEVAVLDLPFTPQQLAAVLAPFSGDDR